MIPLLFALALAPDVPASAGYLLQLSSTAGKCMGTPVGIVQILTAAHCTGSGHVDWMGRWDGREHRGYARLMWRDDERDVAMFAAPEPPGWPVVAIAKGETQTQAWVFWAAYLPAGDVPTVIRGNVLGLDGDGDLVVYGLAIPGSSGSGVLNQQGELIAVLNRVSLRTLVLGFAAVVKGWPQPKR